MTIGPGDYRYYVDGGGGLPEDPNIRVPVASKEGLFGDEGMTFKDALDIINPLQHIPLVNVAYREITGDTIKPGSRVIGGTLFGGPVGLFSAAANSAVEEEFGKDIGGTLVALANGEEVTSQAAKYHGPNGLQFTAYRHADQLAPQTAQAPSAEKVAAPAAEKVASAASSPVLLPSESVAAAPAPASTAPRAGSYGGLATLPPAGTSPLARPLGSPAAAARTAPAAHAAAAAQVAQAPSAASVAAPAVAAPAASAQSVSTPAVATASAAPAVPASEDVAAASAALLSPSGNSASAEPAKPTQTAAASTSTPAAAAPAVQPPIATAAQPRPNGPERQLNMPTRNNMLPARMPVADSRFDVQRQPRPNLSSADTMMAPPTRPTANNAAAAAQQAVEVPSAAPTIPVSASPTAGGQAAQAAAGGQAAQAAGVQDAMMRALAKYDALVKSRRGSGVTEES